MDELQVIGGYVPGVIGRIAELHGTYYAEHWNLGLYFEASVATELAAFYRQLDPHRDGAWVALADGKIVGGIFILGGEADTEGARLRWFILDPAYQGRGAGKRLMQAAMDFCDQIGFRRIYLTTFAGLDTARYLYEKHGFRLCAEVDATALTGDPSKVEQVFERLIARPPQ